MAYHVRIKICGVTNVADAHQAVLLGADALGLNFYPPSPRSIAADHARVILQELPPFTQAVGIFVNESLPRMADFMASLVRLPLAQHHGEHPVLSESSPFSIIAAFPVRDQASLETIDAYLERCRARERMPLAVLVDAHVPGQYGGSGQTAPWRLLADYRPGVPLILAGGLTPENVAEAVRIVRPYAVDVASGVESQPRQKDVEKMRRFIESARAAAAAVTAPQ